MPERFDRSREAASAGLFDEPLQRSPRQFDPNKFDKRLGTAAATTSSAGKLSPRELVSGKVSFQCIAMQLKKWCTNLRGVTDAFGN